MKKAECMAAMPALFNKWCQSEKLESIAKADLSFSAFYSWIEQNHPAYVGFRSTMGPREDIELWLDQHTRQMWKR